MNYGNKNFLSCRPLQPIQGTIRASVIFSKFNISTLLRQAELHLKDKGRSLLNIFLFHKNQILIINCILFFITCFSSPLFL
ncbi:hypothetical protein NEICINOT_04799 [Neisseria cinerea ATCC 14685]|uniref:Uncharacterized protein n=1 Tax=Neisseria cinerea ATCC 14685 TaxID=546262 RepID=D0W550_NEICI|nr:hypothetical protein NEICINOT_04799 [Neisseria cinerea ATCC 14685]